MGSEMCIRDRPYLLGAQSLWPGLVCGGVGLLLAGATAARFTKGSMWLGAGRQLAFGVIAIAATSAVGHLVGAVI